MVSYRLQKKSLQKKVEAGTDHLHVFFIYTARDLPEYSEVAKKMALALDKLEKMIPS